MRKISGLATKVLAVVLATALVVGFTGVRAFADENTPNNDPVAAVVAGQDAANATNPDATTSGAFEITTNPNAGQDDENATNNDKVNWYVQYVFSDKDGNVIKENLSEDPYVTDANSIPVFTENDILSPSVASDGIYADANYVLKTYNDGAKFYFDYVNHIIRIDYEEIEIIDEKPEVVEYPAADFYFTFSIAKAERITDKSDKKTFNGLNYKDYFQLNDLSSYKAKGSKDEAQIKDGVANSTDTITTTAGRTFKYSEIQYNNNGTKKWRTVIFINKEEVMGLMGGVSVNETNGNEIPYSYRIERNATPEAGSTDVEEVLGKLGLKEKVEDLAFDYMTGSPDVTSFLQEKYKDIDFTDGDDWYIDWYVMKTQNNGIHVDGVIVTKYDTEPEQVTWDVLYDFLDKDNKEKDPYEFGFKEVFTVNEGETPDFTDSDILSPSNASDGVYADADFELVTIDGMKFIVNESDHCIIITYREKVKNEEHNEDPKDPEKKEDIPYIPPYEDPEQDPPVDEEPTTEEPEVVTVEPETVPEGAVEKPEVVPVEPVIVPEGAVEEPEEELIVPAPEVPAGDVLPQTGTASTVTFYGIGAACVAFGAIVVLKGRRKEEEA